MPVPVLFPHLIAVGQRHGLQETLQRSLDAQAPYQRWLCLKSAEAFGLDASAERERDELADRHGYR